jgi:hypothetical protein
MPQRSSDIVEVHSERALMSGLGGLVALAVAGILFRFRGDGAMIGLIGILGVGGIAAVAYAIYCALQIRKVQSVSVTCCYCSAQNQLTEQPDRDFTCQHCHRLIPVQDGQVLPVSQVRCGYCNELNYYSAKTDVLLCEQCNREVPIAVDEGRERKTLPKGFAVQDDENLYELVLVAHGHKTEELISTLQHMLALNRNQVKQMLEELPVTLLTGITRRKAEMLQAQLHVSDAAAEFRPIT